MHECCLFSGSYILIQVSSVVIITMAMFRILFKNAFAAYTLKCSRSIVQVLEFWVSSEHTLVSSECTVGVLSSTFLACVSDCKSSILSAFP